MSVLTPNMSLILPVIGVDSGLTWETDVNINSGLIDSHNHSLGYGAPVAVIDSNGLSGTKLVVVSINAPSVNQLGIIRGVVSSAGALVSGEGFTPSKTGTGTYTISFSTGFSDVPAVTASAVASSGVGGAWISSPTTLGFNVGTSSNGSAADSEFSFIAIGQR